MSRDNRARRFYTEVNSVRVKVYVTLHAEFVDAVDAVTRLFAFREAPI